MLTVLGKHVFTLHDTSPIFQVFGTEDMCSAAGRHIIDVIDI